VASLEARDILSLRSQSQKDTRERCIQLSSQEQPMAFVPLKHSMEPRVSACSTRPVPNVRLIGSPVVVSTQNPGASGHRSCFGVGGVGGPLRYPLSFQPSELVLVDAVKLHPSLLKFRQRYRPPWRDQIAQYLG
jgi:hypothetical protein